MQFYFLHFPLYFVLNFLMKNKGSILQGGIL